MTRSYFYFFLATKEFKVSVINFCRVWLCFSPSPVAGLGVVIKSGFNIT